MHRIAQEPNMGIAFLWSVLRADFLSPVFWRARTRSSRVHYEVRVTNCLESSVAAQLSVTCLDSYLLLHRASD